MVCAVSLFYFIDSVYLRIAKYLLILYCHRGNLILTILPTSDLRLSFVGDDGQTDRLFTLNSKSQCSAVEVNEIPEDNSGRSFVVKIPDGRVFHFWCSETSKLLGIELISKVRIYIISFGAYACIDH